MTFWSGPWDPKGSTPAVPMTESEFRELWRGDDDGFTEVGLLTLSNSTGEVTLANARGRIQGAAFIQSGSDSVTVPAVSSGQQRIDYVVLRYNPSNNTISLQVITGTPSSSGGQEPKLEPQRSGSSLLSGPYDIPVARFTGGPGTALQRGESMRPRILRSHFIASAQETWVTINRRRGDIRFMPDSIAWFDPNAGSVGQFTPIYERPPATEFDDDATQYTFNNINPHPTAAFSPSSVSRVGTSFVVGPSGRVDIQAGARISSSQNGQSAFCGWEVKTGGTVGSGTLVAIGGQAANRAVQAGEAVNDGAESRNTAASPPFVLSLNEGNTYNVQCTHWVTSGGTGQIQYRSVIVRPA